MQPQLLPLCGMHGEQAIQLLGYAVTLPQYDPSTVVAVAMSTLLVVAVGVSMRLIIGPGGEN